MYHYAKFYAASMREIKTYFTIDEISKKAIKEKPHENDDAPEKRRSDFGTPR